MKKNLKKIFNKRIPRKIYLIPYSTGYKLKHVYSHDYTVIFYAKNRVRLIYELIRYIFTGDVWHSLKYKHVT